MEQPMKTPKFRTSRKSFTVLFLTFALAGLAPRLPAEQSLLPSPDLQRPVAKVNGVPIIEKDLQNEMESLYPENSAHGGLNPEKLKEIRDKALNELIVEELAYQKAHKQGLLVPMAQVEVEYKRLRTGFTPAVFDHSLKASGLTRVQYLKNLQRRMTLERIYKQRVLVPSQVSAQTVRTYYQKNLKKFERPEQVHARLILAAIGQNASPEEARQAKEKIDKVYQELQAGKDFATLAQQYSDDFYRIKGGDLGWVHRGRLEPEFETVAFSLAPGTFSKPFKTSYGYNLLKVEAREPARLMKFAEVRPVIKAELEQKKLLELRQTWTGQLKRGATIEILSAGTPGSASSPGAGQ
jgi:PPIC-type PPIASE domain/SurA-like N-terminal domain